MAKQTQQPSPGAQRELDAAKRDYGTPEERNQRGADAREASGHARSSGNAAGRTV